MLKQRDFSDFFVHNCTKTLNILLYFCSRCKYKSQRWIYNVTHRNISFLLTIKHSMYYVVMIPYIILNEKFSSAALKLCMFQVGMRTREMSRGRMRNAYAYAQTYVWFFLCLPLYIFAQGVIHLLPLMSAANLSKAKNLHQTPTPACQRYVKAYRLGCKTGF